MSIPEHMSAVVAASPGGPEVLRLEQIPSPAPGPGEVLIRVAAAGVNAPDLLQRRGAYPPPAGASLLLGLEVSGDIAAPSGPWRAGEKVVALCNGGGYAEYVAIPAGQVLAAPSTWNLVDAAALPETWFTITQTLVMRAGLAAGMSVLITGAAGGLGGTTVQIATILGAEAIAIVSSEEKAAYATSLGASHVIRRDKEDIVARARELTAGRGVDRIVDMAGGATTGVLLGALARFGHLVLVSAQAGTEGNIPLGGVLSNQLTMSGSTLRPQSPETKAAIAGVLRSRLWPSLDDPALPHPKIQHFPLTEAASAHRSAEAPGHYGKIVLVTEFGKSLKIGVTADI